MKRAMTIGAVILVVAALAMPAFARGPGWGRGEAGYGPGACPRYGAWDQNLTDEQKGQIDNLRKKFFDSTAQLRNQMWAKRGDLQTLMSSPNPDVEKAKALQKELSDLKAKMAQERLTMQLEERKINPDARFGGWGRGPGQKGGRGFGMGYGRGMGGGGQGPCWN